MSGTTSLASKSVSDSYIASASVAGSAAADADSTQPSEADGAHRAAQGEMVSRSGPGVLPSAAPAYSKEDPLRGLRALGCLPPLPDATGSPAMTQQQQQTAAEMRLLLSMADKPPSFDESQALQEAGIHTAKRDGPHCDWATQDLFTGIRSVPERITVTTADTEHAASTRPTRYTLWPEVVPTDLPADLRARADTFQSMMDTLPRLSTKRAQAGHALLDSVVSSFESRDDFGGISQDVVRKTLAPLADGLDLAECLHLAEHASTHGTTPEEMMEGFAHQPGSLLSFCLSSGPTRDALASDAEAQESWKKKQEQAGRDTLQQRPTYYSFLSSTLREIKDQVEPCMRVSPREEKSYLHALKKERQTLNWLTTKLTTLDKEMSSFAKADKSARRVRRKSRLFSSDDSRESSSQEISDC